MGGKIRFYNKELDVALTIMIILGIAAIITGYARYTTKLPLPTAIFLLILVGFLGVFYKCYERKIINKKVLKYCFWLFEISLLVSAWLSYGSMSFAYFISYNIGIVIFLFFEKKEIQNIAFDKLGVVGMTFFLGAKTPMLFLNYDFDTTFSMRIIGCLVEFILAFGLAFIVTKYIENPLLKYTKK